MNGSTRRVVAVVLGVLGVALVAAGGAVMLSGGDLPPNGVGALLVLIVGVLAALAGVAIANPLRKAQP